ncbi:hypothetical protein DSO57_1027591 [Entomophthora muscae]|uniref:Uncharacterized protein n=1 Tax=Entomophthora muscae TaxID=34485 RepID=A0ACC2UBE9_9FUNG|nr:hypothetical protein DSO57_1027591 [Entomophthora muscae]
MIMNFIYDFWFQMAVLGLLTIVGLSYLEIIYVPFARSDLYLIHNSVRPPKVDCVGWCGDNDGHLLKEYIPEESSKNLLELVLDKCPSLNGTTPFYPSFWLGNTHLQTMFGPSNLSNIPQIQYQRECICLSDGGQVSLDWYPGLPGSNSKVPLDDTTPTVLVLHGMGGGSDASYARALVGSLFSPCSSAAKPTRSVVLNNRGCGNTTITTPRLYTAGDTTDLREAIAHIRARLPNAPLFAVGYSIGANILSKYLGEVGEDTPLVGAVSVSNPFDLVWCSRYMFSNWINSYIYTPFLVRRLKQFFKFHYDVLSKEVKERDWQNISDFDTDLIILNQHIMVSRHRANEKGEMPARFETLNQYYRESSCNRYLHNIKIPTLFINALDDPISSIAAIASDEIHANPNLILAVTRFGGHLGWWADNGIILKKCRSWVTLPVTEFIAALCTPSS